MSKTVLRKGSSFLQRPNRLSTVLASISGCWETPEGGPVEYERRENVAVRLGEYLYINSAYLYITSAYLYITSAYLYINSAYLYITSAYFYSTTPDKLRNEFCGLTDTCTLLSYYTIHK